MARRKASKTPRLVLVHWKDAASAHDDEKGELAPIDCISVGWMIEEADDHVKIAAELGADGEYRDATVIPKGMLVSIMGKPFKLPAVFAGWVLK